MRALESVGRRCLAGETTIRRREVSGRWLLVVLEIQRHAETWCVSECAVAGCARNRRSMVAKAMRPRRVLLLGSESDVEADKERRGAVVMTASQAKEYYD